MGHLDCQVLIEEAGLRKEKVQVQLVSTPPTLIQLAPWLVSAPLRPRAMMQEESPPQRSAPVGEITSFLFSPVSWPGILRVLWKGGLPPSTYGSPVSELCF